LVAATRPFAAKGRPAGIAAIDIDCPNPHSAIAAADRAMYEAKRRGRNRVEIASAPVRAYGLTG
jgi:hypothetical protein